MYPLYIASRLSLGAVKQRTWMRGRLWWIGKHMGIRQATMLADVCLVHHSYANVPLLTVLQNSLAMSSELVADGHILLFAGALMRPIESQPALLATH